MWEEQLSKLAHRFFSMPCSNKQYDAGKIKELFEKARSGAGSPAFVVIRDSYTINGSPVRSQLQDLPVIVHVSSF